VKFEYIIAQRPDKLVLVGFESPIFWLAGFGSRDFNAGATIQPDPSREINITRAYTT